MHGERGSCILKPEFGVEDATHMAFSFGDRMELGGKDWHSLTEY